MAAQGDIDEPIDFERAFEGHDISELSEALADILVANLDDVEQSLNLTSTRKVMSPDGRVYITDISMIASDDTLSWAFAPEQITRVLFPLVAEIALQNKTVKHVYETIFNVSSAIRGVPAQQFLQALMIQTLLDLLKSHAVKKDVEHWEEMDLLPALAPLALTKSSRKR